MTTANDIMNQSLRLIGQLAGGEVPSGPDSNDALFAFNMMLDSWSTERLSVFATQDQVFTWQPNIITQTLGPSGDFVGNRPILLDDATYFKDPSSGLSFGVLIINQEQYDGISLKTVTSTYPEVIFVNYDMPNVTMKIFPVPTKALEWHFVSVQELSKPATLATNLVFPPGYMRAFIYNLAIEIANMWGVPAPQNVVSIAISSKRNIKRINNPQDLMAMPYVLVQKLRRFNIFNNTPS